jgi:hypothetical protein
MASQQLLFWRIKFSTHPPMKLYYTFRNGCLRVIRSEYVKMRFIAYYRKPEKHGSYERNGLVARVYRINKIFS